MGDNGDDRAAESGEEDQSIRQALRGTRLEIGEIGDRNGIFTTLFLLRN
jgi:hypothetical protein